MDNPSTKLGSSNAMALSSSPTAALSHRPASTAPSSTATGIEEGECLSPLVEGSPPSLADGKDSSTYSSSHNQPDFNTSPALETHQERPSQRPHMSDFYETQHGGNHMYEVPRHHDSYPPRYNSRPYYTFPSQSRLHEPQSSVSTLDPRDVPRARLSASPPPTSEIKPRPSYYFSSPPPPSTFPRLGSRSRERAFQQESRYEYDHGGHMNRGMYGSYYNSSSSNYFSDGLSPYTAAHHPPVQSAHIIDLSPSMQHRLQLYLDRLRPLIPVVESKLLGNSPCHLCNRSSIAVANCCPKFIPNHSFCASHLMEIFEVDWTDIIKEPLNFSICPVCSRQCPCQYCTEDAINEVEEYDTFRREKELMELRKEQSRDLEVLHTKHDPTATINRSKSLPVVRPPATILQRSAATERQSVEISSAPSNYTRIYTNSSENSVPPFKDSPHRKPKAAAKAAGSAKSAAPVNSSVSSFIDSLGRSSKARVKRRASGGDISMAPGKNSKSVSSASSPRIIGAPSSKKIRPPPTQYSASKESTGNTPPVNNKVVADKRSNSLEGQAFENNKRRRKVADLGEEKVSSEASLRSDAKDAKSKPKMTTIMPKLESKPASTIPFGQTLWSQTPLYLSAAPALSAQKGLHLHAAKSSPHLQCLATRTSTKVKPVEIGSTPQAKTPVSKTSLSLSAAPAASAKKGLHLHAAKSSHPQGLPTRTSAKVKPVEIGSTPQSKVPCSMIKVKGKAATYIKVSRKLAAKTRKGKEGGTLLTKYIEMGSKPKTRSEDDSAVKPSSTPSSSAVASSNDNGAESKETDVAEKAEVRAQETQIDEVNKATSISRYVANASAAKKPVSTPPKENLNDLQAECKKVALGTSSDEKEVEKQKSSTECSSTAVPQNTVREKLLGDTSSGIDLATDSVLVPMKGKEESVGSDKAKKVAAGVSSNEIEGSGSNSSCEIGKASDQSTKNLADTSAVVEKSAVSSEPGKSVASLKKKESDGKAVKKSTSSSATLGKTRKSNTFGIPKKGSLERNGQKVEGYAVRRGSLRGRSSLRSDSREISRTKDIKRDSKKEAEDTSRPKVQDSSKVSAERLDKLFGHSMYNPSDANFDECSICDEVGDLVMCDRCPRAFHPKCLNVKAEDLPDEWVCKTCSGPSVPRNRLRRFKASCKFKTQKDRYLYIVKKLRDEEFAESFLEPVVGVPLYYDVVKKPMDLSTVESKIKKDKYRSDEQFAQDIRQIWTNCKIFNAESASISRMSDCLSSIFETYYEAMKELS